jgi:transglutaminase-like putative cysteine protease
VILSIGCLLELECPAATPLLVLVHPHRSRQADLQTAETVSLQPDRPYEVLTDQLGNRWCRLVAANGRTRFQFSTSLHCDDSPEPVVRSAPQTPVQFLPVDAYPYLNASTYCDTQALMALAWDSFGSCGLQGWGLVEAICDWVHKRIRFDRNASQPHQTASQTIAAGAGVCRDFAHLAITLSRCLNIPARYCTGYLRHGGLAAGEAPVDFSSWFEVYLGDRWFSFDARHNHAGPGRVLIARGRDAGDVPFLKSFGSHRLTKLTVISEPSDQLS